MVSRREIGTLFGAFYQEKALVGLLCDCEIFANLRITFVWSSSVQCADMRYPRYLLDRSGFIHQYVRRLRPIPSQHHSQSHPAHWHWAGLGGLKKYKLYYFILHFTILDILLRLFLGHDHSIHRTESVNFIMYFGRGATGRGQDKLQLIWHTAWCLDQPLTIENGGVSDR